MEYLIGGAKGRVIAFLDMALAGIRVFSPRPPELPAPERVRNVVYVRLDHIGDVLMATPAVEALARACPSAQISVLVKPSCAPLFENNPFVSRVIEYVPAWQARPTLGERADGSPVIERLRASAFDVAFFPRGDLREIFLGWRAGIPHRIGIAERGGGALLTKTVPLERNRHEIEKNLAATDFFTHGTQVERREKIYLTGDEIAAARGVLERDGIDPDRPFVVLHPGAAGEHKKYPLSHFAEVAKRLSHTMQVLWTPEPGAARPDGVGIGGARVLSEVASLRRLAAIFSLSRAVIANDSGPMHLAIAADTPVAAIFGPTDPLITGPTDVQKNLVLRAGPDCAPCWYPGTPITCADTRCMRDLSPQKLLVRLIPWLEGVASAGKT